MNAYGTIGQDTKFCGNQVLLQIFLCLTGIQVLHYYALLWEDLKTMEACRSCRKKVKAVLQDLNPNTHISATLGGLQPHVNQPLLLYRPLKAHQMARLPLRLSSSYLKEKLTCDRLLLSQFCPFLWVL